MPAASADDENEDVGVPMASATLEGARGYQRPDRQLAQAGERLQDVVAVLEELLFDTPGLGPHCRSEVHDAIGLVMDALQMLGSAQTTLNRRRNKRGNATTLMVPMARA